MRDAREEFRLRAVGAVQLRRQLLELLGPLLDAARLVALVPEDEHERDHGQQDATPDGDTQHRRPGRPCVVVANRERDHHAKNGKAEGRANMRDLLGGKGANLAEMANLGLPVPPGFTIPTSVCTYFYANGKTYPKELQSQVERVINMRRSDLDDQLAELCGLRGKNATVIASMRARIEAEHKRPRLPLPEPVRKPQQEAML